MAARKARQKKPAGTGGTGSPAASQSSAKARIAANWEIWAAENLLRGVPRNEVAARLMEAGASERATTACLTAIMSSPAFVAALPFARDARRLALHTRLRKAMANLASDPTGIPRRAGVGADELRDTYVAANTPVILTDIVPRWKAFGTWTPRALAERFSDVQVDVTVDRESDPDYDMNAAAHTVAMSMSALVEKISAGESNDVYLVARGRALQSTELRVLLDEIVMPEGYAAEPLHGAQLWLGPAGTVTPLHHDTSNILFCQVYGRKRWKLAAPHELALLEGARSLYAGMDPERDDFRRVLVKDVVLEAGEALFVPMGWWHHVRALDASISVALNGLAFANHFNWYRPGQIR